MLSSHGIKPEKKKGAKRRRKVGRKQKRTRARSTNWANDELKGRKNAGGGEKAEAKKNLAGGVVLSLANGPGWTKPGPKKQLK